jgi:hypothetical protein
VALIGLFLPAPVGLHARADCVLLLSVYKSECRRRPAERSVSAIELGQNKPFVSVARKRGRRHELHGYTLQCTSTASMSSVIVY